MSLMRTCKRARTADKALNQDRVEDEASQRVPEVKSQKIYDVRVDHNQEVSLMVPDKDHDPRREKPFETKLLNEFIVQHIK